MLIRPARARCGQRACTLSLVDGEVRCSCLELVPVRCALHGGDVPCVTCAIEAAGGQVRTSFTLVPASDLHQDLEREPVPFSVGRVTSALQSIEVAPDIRRCGAGDDRTDSPAVAIPRRESSESFEGVLDEMLVIYQRAKARGNGFTLATSESADLAGPWRWMALIHTVPGVMRRG